MESKKRSSIKAISYTAFHVGHVNGRPLFSFENWYPGAATLNTNAESTLTPGNYYMVTFLASL